MEQSNQENELKNLETDFLSDCANEINNIIDSIGSENTARKRGWAKIKLLGIISKCQNVDIINNLNGVIIECEKNEKLAKESGMEYISLTSGAMGTAYRNVRSWLQNNS